MFRIRPTDVFRLHLQTSLDIGNDVLTDLVVVIAVTLKMRRKELHTPQNPENVQCSFQRRIETLT